MEFTEPLITAEAQLKRAWEAASIGDYGVAATCMRDVITQATMAEGLLAGLRDRAKASAE